MDYTARLHNLGLKAPSKKELANIADIEAQIGVPLPAGYRAFLASCGGWWGDILCPCEEPTPFGKVHGISSFHSSSEVLSLLDSVIAPRNMVTIAAGHFTKYTCLSVAGVDHGSVYAVDGELRAYWSDEEFKRRYNQMDPGIQQYLKLRREEKLPEKPMGYLCTYFLARSFVEFLEKCKAC